MPGEHEEENESYKAGANQDLEETQDGDKPVEKRFSQKPIGNHADDSDRLKDGQDQVNDVGIVELVMVRQPAASDQISIDRRGSDQMNDRNELGFQRRRHRNGSLSLRLLGEHRIASSSVH